MFNSRLDYLRNQGGDTTQILETEKVLKTFGVNTELATAAPKNVKDWDVIHVFNLQTIESAVDLIDLASIERTPIVLSTIYWDLRYASNEDHMKYSAGMIYGSIAAVSPKLSLTLYRMRYFYGGRRQKRLQRKALSKSDLVLPNSVAELEILVQFFDMPKLRARSLIVPNAVSCECMSIHDRKALKNKLPLEYVLMAASFHPVKGQHRVIQALKDNKDIPLVFAGRIDRGSIYGRYCIQMAENRGNSYILGNVEYSDMPLLYSRAKVHVLPSLRESPGLASLEAAIHGANCVISIHAPVWEYFKNEAYVCDPLDASSIKHAVLEAWKSERKTELKKMILKEFTWEKAASITLQAYEYAIKNKK